MDIALMHSNHMVQYMFQRMRQVIEHLAESCDTEATCTDIIYHGNMRPRCTWINDHPMAGAETKVFTTSLSSTLGGKGGSRSVKGAPCDFQRLRSAHQQHTDQGRLASRYSSIRAGKALRPGLSRPHSKPLSQQTPVIIPGMHEESVCGSRGHNRAQHGGKVNNRNGTKYVESNPPDLDPALIVAPPKVPHAFFIIIARRDLPHLP